MTISKVRVEQALHPAGRTVHPLFTRCTEDVCPARRSHRVRSRTTITFRRHKDQEATFEEGTVTKFLAKIVAWITAGYPEGVPGPDRVPLFALLKRRPHRRRGQGGRDGIEGPRRVRQRRHRRADHPDHRRAADARGCRAGASPTWPPRAGLSTTRVTPRRPNSRPAHPSPSPLVLRRFRCCPWWRKRSPGARRYCRCRWATNAKLP